MFSPTEQLYAALKKSVISVIWGKQMELEMVVMKDKLDPGKDTHLQALTHTHSKIQTFRFNKHVHASHTHTRK